MGLFEGVFPAILTPFDSEGKFHPAAFEAFIDHMYRVGVAGVFVCGVIGEGLMMSPEEREHAAEVAVAASRGRGKVLVHVGSGTTEDSVRLAKHARKIGADGLGCLAPYTNQYSLDSLVKFFTAVAQAADSVPLMVYLNPSISPSLHSYDQLQRLLEIPGIAGVKFSSRDAAELAYAIYDGSERRTVLCGVDEMFMSALLMGAHGAITAMGNVLPDLFVEIYRLAKAGKWKEANEVQHRICDISRIVETKPYISALKTTARWQGYELGEPRSPAFLLTPALEAELREGLEKADLRLVRPI